MLRNLSSEDLEWRQTQSVEAKQVPDGLPHSLSPDSRSEVPLRWSSGNSQRLLSVRTRDGAYEWSPGFSPSTVGEAIIKLRICPHYAAAAEAMGQEERPAVLYLRLTVSMDKVSSRRILVIRPIGGVGGLLRLDYLIKNDSLLLLAFRQSGCAHWDLLGAGEAAEYAWDAPLASRHLSVIRRLWAPLQRRSVRPHFMSIIMPLRLLQWTRGAWYSPTNSQAHIP